MPSTGHRHGGFLSMGRLRIQGCSKDEHYGLDEMCLFPPPKTDCVDKALVPGWWHNCDFLLKDRVLYIPG